MTTSSSSSTSSSSTKMDNNNNNNIISYRKARIEDLPGIVDLLERSFEEDDNDNDNDEEDENEDKQEEGTPPPSSSNNNDGVWPISWNPFAQTKKDKQEEEDPLDETQKLIQLLKERLRLPQHVMIVATTTTTTTTSSSNEEEEVVVGFMELGTMPAPIAISVPVNLPPSAPVTIKESSTVMVRPERPFLANLAVDPNWRRQQMGFKLVQLALKIATTWESTKAKASQKTLGGFYFHPSSASNKDKKKKEKLSTLYLSVDCDNAGAIAFYQRLEFTTVLDESSSLSNEENQDKVDGPATTKRRGARKPKLYLEKELVLSIEDE